MLPGSSDLLDRPHRRNGVAVFARQERDLAGPDPVLAGAGPVEPERALHHALMQRVGARSSSGTPGSTG